MDPVERFLALLRGVHPFVVTLFLNGGCFELYRILREIWPEAEAWRDEHWHVYTRVGRRWYDIHGKRAGPPVGLWPMTGKEQHDAFRWRGRIKLDWVIERHKAAQCDL